MGDIWLSVHSVEEDGVWVILMYKVVHSTCLCQRRSTGTTCRFDV